MRYLNNGIQTIKVNEIMDYSDCPMKYYFKYIDEDLKDKYVNIEEKYDKDIKTTLYSFFINRKLKGKYKLSTLKRSWGSNWIGSKTDKELIFETTGVYSKFEQYKNKGIKTIFDVYEHFRTIDADIIAINEEFKIRHKNIDIVDKWDLIIKLNQTDELIIFDFRTNSVSKTDIKYNIRSTANALAFDKYFGKREDRLVYYDLNKVRTYEISRDDKDIQLYERTVEQVVKAIKNKIFFAKPDSKCETCQYKSYCFNSIERIN